MRYGKGWAGGDGAGAARTAKAGGTQGKRNDRKGGRRPGRKELAETVWDNLVAAVAVFCAVETRQAAVAAVAATVVVAYDVYAARTSDAAEGEPRKRRAAALDAFSVAVSSIALFGFARAAGIV